MKIIEDQGFCTSCGRFADFKYGEDNFSYVAKNLDNYNKYKDFYVFQCRSCGFVSSNITAEEGVLCGPIKNIYEYNQLLDYAYLKGLDKELYDSHSQDIPANLYEAYSLVALECKNYENYIRSLNKSIELKQIMARKYKLSKDELGGEEENDQEYEELDNLIKESITTNRQQIDYYFNFVENKNIFIKLIQVENLFLLGKKAEALKMYTDVLRQNKPNKDLNDYFKDLLQLN